MKSVGKKIVLFSMVSGKRILRFNPVISKRVRINIVEYRLPPAR